VLWYVPKGQRPLYFRTQSERLNGLSGIPLPHPGLVFRAERAGGKKSLRVWAFRRRGRPTADTVLYTAPFLNVFAGGSVCLGSTRVPATSGPADAGAWTDAFFASAFTHGQRDFLVGMPGYAGTLSACADDPSLGFPSHRLKRAGLRLRDVVAEM
jgi:PRTRC genetic system protein B